MKLALAHEAKTTDAPVIYVVDSLAHPFAVTSLAHGLHSAVVSVAIEDWNDALAPWPANGMRKEDPPFGGNAANTLADLQTGLQEFERTHGFAPCARAIAGYSLGGLFALYAALNTPAFLASASVSGSLWYDGWIDYLKGLTCGSSYPHLEEPATDNTHPRFAFLSVGTKEKRAAQPRIKRIEERVRQTADLLEERGTHVQVVVGPGSHFQFVDERISLALRTLDAALATLPSSKPCTAHTVTKTTL